LQEAEERDPILLSTGFAKVRFYMFTNETDISKSDAFALRLSLVQAEVDGSEWLVSAVDADYPVCVGVSRNSTIRA
jgi:hypothetical protein